MFYSFKMFSCGHMFLKMTCLLFIFFFFFLFTNVDKYYLETLRNLRCYNQVHLRSTIVCHCRECEYNKDRKLILFSTNNECFKWELSSRAVDVMFEHVVRWYWFKYVIIPDQDDVTMKFAPNSDEFKYSIFSTERYIVNYVGNVLNRYEFLQLALYKIFVAL